MAAHPLLLGDELSAFHARGEPIEDDSATGRALAGLQRVAATLPVVGDGLEQRIDDAADQLAQLRLLVDHLEELEARDIRFTSAFLSPASNTIIPDIAPVRAIAPRWAGPQPRQRRPGGLPAGALPRRGLGAVPPRHRRQRDHRRRRPCGGDHRAGGRRPPLAGHEQRGRRRRMDWLHDADTHLLLVLSSTQPWVEGLPWAPNTTGRRRAGAAGRGRSPDRGARRHARCRRCRRAPSRPATPRPRSVGWWPTTSPSTWTAPRAGRCRSASAGPGVQAIRGLGEGPWTGTAYTEMLDPLTWDLVDEGTITGSHSLHDGERDRARRPGAVHLRPGRGGRRVRRGASTATTACGWRPPATSCRSRPSTGALGINNILGIDFNGHVNAFARDRNPWSGVGGQATIMRGLAVGGIAYLCCKSTHRTPEGEVRSSIWPTCRRARRSR